MIDELFPFKTMATIPNNKLVGFCVDDEIHSRGLSQNTISASLLKFLSIQQLNDKFRKNND